MIAGHVYVIHTSLARPKPKDKITLCICAAHDLFFWINTKPSVHGVGQFLLRPEDHRQSLTHDCYLDCSRATTFSAAELAAARPRDSISHDLAARIVAFLTASPPKTLPVRHLALAVANLSKLIPVPPA